MARRILITGGSSGIGAALVRWFVGHGDEVLFTYNRGADRAQALIEELGGTGLQALAFEQGNWASHERFLAALPGPVDVLINNAGLGSKTVEAVAEQRHLQDQALLQVNAVGVLWLTDALLPAMLARGAGKIINISSVGGGISQFPGFRLADTMSKAAVAALTRQLAAETARTGVDVFAICPGATDTAMFDASTLSALTPEARAAFVAALPKGRLISPGEIAELAGFLCSEAGAVLHGAVLDASLGLGVGAGLPANPD